MVIVWLMMRRVLTSLRHPFIKTSLALLMIQVFESRLEGGE
jgi:hypothetical protein